MSQHKNKIITGLFALSCVSMLAGCSDIEARIVDYDEPIIVNKDDSSKVDVYENFLGDLYDAIAKGQNDRVFEEFLKAVINDQFGSYEELRTLAGGKASATDLDAEATKAFIEKHAKVYKRESDEKLAETYGTTVDAIRIERVFNTYKDIFERINKSFYSDITSSTYAEDGVFSEKTYAYAKYADFYKVSIDRTDFFKGNVTAMLNNGTLTKENVSAVLDVTKYDDYVLRSLAPKVMKEKIVEEYLYSNYYSTLGRSYARKVQLIKLTASSDDASLLTVPYNVMRSYVENVVYNTASTLTFKNLQNAWRGFKGLDVNGNIVDLDDAEKAILTSAGLTASGVYKYKVGDEEKTFNYFPETQVGILLDKWNLVKGDEVDGNRYPDGEEGSNGKVSAALTLFTGSNAYPKAVGLKKELAKVAEEKYLEDGWYVKNGGLTSYPDDSIRSRLFNINVSNNLDDKDIISKMETTKPTAVPEGFDQTKQYVRYINNRYYLIPDKYETDSFAYNMVIIDGTNYYMVQVEEAPSTSKLNLEKGYATYKDAMKKDSPLFTEKVATEVAKVLSNKDSYTNNAYASYIEDYSVTYHDQSLLDYFKEKFPELFE